MSPKVYTPFQEIRAGYTEVYNTFHTSAGFHGLKGTDMSAGWRNSSQPEYSGLIIKWVCGLRFCVGMCVCDVYACSHVYVCAHVYGDPKLIVGTHFDPAPPLRQVS